ncbi:MAG TPA: SMI1/KNR4 family protein [Pirellulales bacterium]
MNLKSLIAEAIEVYEVAGTDCAQKLLPPASDAEIDSIASAVGMAVPVELRELLRIHGGQEYFGVGIDGLFGQHRLFSPAEIIGRHTMYTTVLLDIGPPVAFPPAAGQWGYWVPQLLPFAGWDAYDLCIDAKCGEVWEFNPGTGLIGPWPSISAVLREVVDAVRAGEQPLVNYYRVAEDPEDS